MALLVIKAVASVTSPEVLGIKLQGRHQERMVLGELVVEELLDDLGHVVAVHCHLREAPSVARSSSLFPSLALGAFKLQP